MSIYGNDCRSWNRRVIAEQPWFNFKDNFKLAYTSCHEIQLTMKDSTFHGANITIANEHSETINALATNQFEQHNLVANVVQQSSTLLDQIKQLQTSIAALTSSKNKDTSRDSSGNGRGGGGGSSGNRRVK